MDKTRLNEALQMDYRLRSTFFYRKLYELGFAVFHTEIEKLIAIGDNFNWEDRANWGISSVAWHIINESQTSPLAIFAHPRVLQEQPTLSAYYRNVAVLPQKAVNKLAFGIPNIELGKSGLSADRALILCRLYNAHSSLIVESATDYSQRDSMMLMLASAGAQINGAWLNKIGEEAELIVRKLLIRTLLQADYIVSTILKKASSSTDFENLVDRADELSGIRLKNQTSILFSSEPDLAFLNAKGELVAVMEIKGGKDTAGALERYGAAKKSFEEARRQNPQVITVFVASSITTEVKKRLETDSLINHTYNLTDLVVDEDQRRLFVRFALKFLDVDLG